MIYISSSCINAKKISESVKYLADAGFQNIELSGGTNYYDNYYYDLISLKKEYKLNYRLHNYFPPPKKNFILNLSSKNKKIFEMSMLQCMEAIDLSIKLGSTELGIHAGFLIDIADNEFGKKINKKIINSNLEGIEMYVLAWKKLINYADNKIKLYIENNVISKHNYRTHGNKNPFLLTDSHKYKELLDKMNFNLLLDLAHLKVSCNSLGLSFKDEFNFLIQRSDYIHISGNNGYEDENKSFTTDKVIMQLLKQSKLKDKKITLEIYESIDIIKENYDELIKYIDNEALSN